MMESTLLSQKIKTDCELIATTTFELQMAKMPELMKRYSARQLEKVQQDIGYHIQFLIEAVSAKSPVLFANYLLWLKEILDNLGLPPEDLKMSIHYLADTLSGLYGAEYEQDIAPIINDGLEKLEIIEVHTETFLKTGLAHTELAKRYLAALLTGDRHQANEMIQTAVKSGTPIKEIYLQVFQNTQYEIGRLWQIGQITVAQEHYCTAASQFIMAQLYPYIFTVPNQGFTVLATCVGKELHEIGLRMVTDLMELSGLNTYYLGANVPAASIISAIKEEQANILAISATMTFHVSEVKALIDQIRTTEGGQDIKIMVGGYPFNIDGNLWKHVGADGYAADSETAVLLAYDLAKRS